MPSQNHPDFPVDPQLDLEFERVVDVPPALVWRAWTTPSLITQWFTPVPWKTIACDIDLRPGGVFHTVMQSPEGQQFPNSGCYLDVLPHERLVWTNALGPGFRPLAELPSPCITASILLAPHPQGTLYRAVARHRTAQERQAHADMGFEAGWGKALEQLVDAVKRL